LKRLFIPLITVAALGLAVVGVGAGFAQQGNETASTFLAKVAAKLGIGEDKLTTAVDEAYQETLDEAVTAGRLTQEQADTLKERGFDFVPQFGPGFGERGPMGGVRVMDAAATVLGMTVDDLMTELKDGKSLVDVAAAKGISQEKLTADLLAQVKTQLDGLVSDGKLTQEQADNIYTQTESNIDQIVSDTSGFNFGPRFGPGFGERGPRGGVRVKDAAATVLGMTVDDLMTALKDGKSLADVAAAQGISVEKLTADLLTQVKTQLDGLVSDGKLTQEQADNIYTQTESNIDQVVSDTSGFNFGHGFGERGPRGGVQVMDAAATVLGMSVDDLMTALKDGKSLADVAAAQGINVDKLTADLLAQVKTQLDGLVSDGKLTQEQADSIYTQTESNIDQIVSDTSGFGGPCGPRGGPGPGPMPGSSDSSTPGGMVQPETGL